MSSSSRQQLQHGSAPKGDYSPGCRAWSLPRLVKVLAMQGKKRVCVALFALLAFLFSSLAHANQIPDRAYKYRAFLIREARFEYGMDAPVPMFAGQIHQESAWRPDVSSPYADGLTQFTPDTAKWIAEIYPDLGQADVFNPKWAIRALLKYNKHLYGNFSSVSSECDRWAFVLASYNGGLGWIRKEQRLAATDGKDRNLWWDSVELYNARADWAYEENRDYPRKIIYVRQEYYIKDGSKWTGKQICVTESEPVEIPRIEEPPEVIVVTEVEITETPAPTTEESETEEVESDTGEQSLYEQFLEWWNSWTIFT